MQDSSLEDTTKVEPLPQSAFLRQTMVDCQIRTFDVTDQKLLARMLEVPREQFLPVELAQLAYSDSALELKAAAPGEEGRTLLPPLILARLLQGAGVTPADNVLDIAPGTGYSTALLAGLAKRVVALESEHSLYQELRSNLADLEIANVQIVLGPLAVGAPDEGPFDVIFVHGTVEANLGALFAQLKDGGRLLAFNHFPGDPSGHAGKAVRYGKTGGASGSRVLFDASVPVLNAFQKDEQFIFA